MQQEQDLIIQAQSGNQECFSTLIKNYKNLVFSLVLRMVKNKEDAEEVTQDAFVKAWKSIKQFKGESKFSTWLYKIAYFTSINHLRKRKGLRSDLHFNKIESGDSSVFKTLNGEDRRKILQQAMDYLKPIDRNLINLFYWKELTIKEIEVITLFTEANIKVKLMRIRKKLNGILTALLKNELKDFSR